MAVDLKGSITIKSLETNYVQSGIDNSLDELKKGSLSITARDDANSNTITAQLIGPAPKEPYLSRLEFDANVLIKNVAQGQVINEGVTKEQIDDSNKLVAPADDAGEIAASQLYLPKLMRPDQTGGWGAVGNANTLTGTVNNRTDGRFIFAATHGSYDGLAIYKPLFDINTKYIYQEYELVVKGLKIGGGEFTDDLFCKWGVITQSDYTNAPADAQWAHQPDTYANSFIIRVVLDTGAGNQFNVITSTSTDVFHFDPLGGAPPSGASVNVLPVEGWVKPGLRVQIGIAHYTATTNSQVEIVFIYNGVRKSYGSVTIGPNTTDGSLTGALDSTIENLHFCMTNSACSTPQEWRLPTRPLHKYYGDIFSGSNLTPFRVV